MDDLLSIVDVLLSSAYIAHIRYARLNSIDVSDPTSHLAGLKTKERQTAWREKMGLLFIIFCLMAAVGFITFGFTQTVCGRQALRVPTGSVATGSMVFHGYDYSMDRFEHPGAAGIQENSNPLYSDFNAGSMDGSFLFQKVNQRCLNILTPAAGTGIPHNGNQMAWYFPCNMFDQYGTSQINKTGYAEGILCHTQNDARRLFSESANDRVIGMKREGPVYFTWEDVRNTSRNLAVYEGLVAYYVTRELLADATFD